MADNVDELSVLIEDLKRENELRNEDYSKILTEIKTKIEDIDENNASVSDTINLVKERIENFSQIVHKWFEN